MLSGRTPLHLGDESGFTLIELLVAMVTGIIVTGALFAILEVSMHQTARVTDVTQANQLGRTTMTHIVDEMHSACISADEFTPIQEKSEANKVIFLDAYSEKAEIPSAHKDEITWNPETHTMVDKTYLSNGGSWPKFTFPTTATPSQGVVIGEHITQVEPKAGEKLPIFQYFAYSTKSSTAPTEPSTTLSKTLTSPLGPESAKEAASVLINFKAAPTSNVSSRAIELSNQVTFAFSAPAAESPVEGAPCE